MDETLVGLGKRIHKLRRKAGLTQAQLAEKAEVSAKYIGGIERERGNPSFAIIARIARGLGISLSDMLLDYQCEGLPREEVKAQIDQVVKEANEETCRKALRILKVLRE